MKTDSQKKNGKIKQTKIQYLSSEEYEKVSKETIKKYKEAFQELSKK